MEGLVLLISAVAEAALVIIPLIVEAVALIAIGIGELVSSLILLLLDRSRTAPATKQPATDAPSRPPTTAKRAPPGRSLILWRRWRWRLLVATGGLFAVTLVTLVIVNLFFFGAVIRWAAADLPQRHGVTLDFADADGNLFTGRVHLAQASVKRPQHPTATFDVTINDVHADINLTRLMQRQLELEDVVVRGIRGEYTRVGSKPEQPPKRGYTIQRLRLEDARLTWNDATKPQRPIQLEIEVDELETQPFRSSWAAFDILFRSNGTGRIEGGAFTLSTREIPDGRETEWQARDLPVALAAAYLAGPFRWITEGTLDVDVVDRWQLPDDAPDIEMDWNLTFRNVRAETPDDLAAPLQVVAKPVVSYFNAHAEQVPLGLRLKLNKREFTGRMSPPLEEITDAVADEATKVLADKLGVAKVQIEDKGRQLLDKARNLLKRDQPQE